MKRLIYFESPLPDVDKKVNEKEFENLPNDFIAKNFTDLTELGRKNCMCFSKCLTPIMELLIHLLSVRNPPEQPKPDSIAIVMCTSGTTGAPKGMQKFVAKRRAI